MPWTLNHPCTERISALRCTALMTFATPGALEFAGYVDVDAGAGCWVSMTIPPVLVVTQPAAVCLILALQVCVYLSNQTQLRRPGFMAAVSCSWTLPFVCESSLPTELISLVPNAPPPVTPPAAIVPASWVGGADWGSTGPGE
jgi:hypothetical protein